jgi:hypothetical protein
MHYLSLCNATMYCSNWCVPAVPLCLLNCNNYSAPCHRLLLHGEASHLLFALGVTSTCVVLSVCSLSVLAAASWYSCWRGSCTWWQPTTTDHLFVMAVAVLALPQQLQHVTPLHSAAP